MRLHAGIFFPLCTLYHTGMQYDIKYRYGPYRIKYSQKRFVIR